jgi:hypothetical protein
MHNITKKFIVSVVMIAFAATFAVPTTSAATVEELQAQIAALLVQIQALQAQLGTVQGTTGTGACTGITFSRTLKLGMAGTDVKCLQAILNQSADTQVSASGAGAPGSETTYFGAKTKAAVIVFQQKYASEVLTPIGLTAGTGLVGAKTVAKLNTLIGAVGGTGGTGGTGVVLPTASGLTVAVAADNPISTTIVSGGGVNAGSQALIPYLKLNFSTPAGTSAKVTTLKLKRLGISTDTDVPNVYLYEGDTKLAEMTSQSLGVITFTNAAGLFTVSGTKTITLKADLYKAATAGKTIGLAIAASTDVVTDASAVNGTFPINGNLMTTALVADFGRLTVATSTNSGTVDPGIIGWEAMRITLAAANQKIKIYSIKFLQLGSIQKTDIANLGLYSGATQLGTTQAALASDGTVTFDLSSAPYEIGSGITRTLSLKADVIGGSTRTIRFSLQRSSDIVAKDDNYGVYVAPDVSAVATFSVLDSTSALVTEGNLTISRATDSPSANVALNSSNITLAKFNIKAVGEDVRVSSLYVKVATTSAATAWDTIKNIRVLYDGSQVGTTVTVTPAPNATSTFSFSFTVPVGQTKVLEVKADIQGDNLASGDKIIVYLGKGTSNVQRMTSLGAFGFPASDQAGNELTVSAAGLSAAKNTTIGDITAVNNSQGVIIGSWFLTAGSAEGVDISRIGIKDASTSGSGAAGTATNTAQHSLGEAFTNLELYYGSTKLGSTVVPTDSTPSTEYSFYPSGFSLAAGQTVRIDLKANVNPSPTWWGGNAAQLSSAESSGKITSNSANIGTPGATPGQALTLSGAGVLSLALDSSAPEGSIVAMGDTEKIMGIWKLSANNTEDITVSQIIAFNRAITTSSSNVLNLKLLCGADQFGTTQGGLILASGKYYAAFGGATCLIPKGSSKLITLKSDITSYGSGATASGYLQFYLEIPSPITGLSTSAIIARGAADYASTTANTSSSANLVYPYRTSLTSALACNGACTGRTRSATDKIATLTLTGVASADSMLRAALDGNDNTGVGWASATADTISTSTAAASVLAASSTSVEGDASVYYLASTTAATTTWAAVYAGDLSGYSKISLWLYSGPTTTARTVFITGTSSFRGFIDRTASTTSGALTAGKWNRVELDIPAGTNSTTTYIGVALPTQFINSNAPILIDAIKAYNDSITVTIGGNTTNTAQGQAVYLKTTGGTTKAVDYFDYNNSLVEFVPSSDISVGVTPVALEMISDTTTLIESAITGVSRTLSLSIPLGSVSSAGVITAGGFRWNDQAMAVTTPITWMSGASPISVTLSLASGN